MSKKLLDHFMKSLVDVFKEMADINVDLETRVNNELESMHILGIASVINFTGKVKGRVMLEMEPVVAVNTTKRITNENFENVKDFMVLSTVAELNNIVSGKAITPINNNLGLDLWMSPPYVFTGNNTIITIPKLKAVSIKSKCKYGYIRISIAFEEEV